MDQIGELFVLGFRGPTIPQWLRSFAGEFGLGGVILFDYDCLDKKYERNVFSPAQVRELCAEIHSLPSHPLVYVDQEGGKVRRLKDKYGFHPLPSAKQFAKLSLTERMETLRLPYRQMKDVGIDVNLAPVVDLDFNPNSPDLGVFERSFSSDIMVVEQCAHSLIEMSRLVGLKLCLKHYPGCGGAHVNPHNELMDLTDTYSEAQVQLFHRLLPHIPMVLFSHGTVNHWEAGVPVCLSPVAVGKVRAAHAPSIVITDDLQMHGVQGLMSTSDAAMRAIQAGVDLILIGNNMLDEQELSASIVQNLARHAQSTPQLVAQIKAAIQRVKALK